LTGICRQSQARLRGQGDRIMTKVIVLSLLFCISNLYALSSDDFIVQQVTTSGDHTYRSKIYLGQIWGEAKIDDKLVKTETRETWSGYKDVVIYYYENIEIITARFIRDAPYRWIVDITITGKKYCTMREITVGNSIKVVEGIYGKPHYELPSEGFIYSVYRINDPHSDYGDNTREYNISYIHKNNIIEKITVHYVFNI
jgi:hypothetical protein